MIRIKQEVQSTEKSLALLQSELKETEMALMEKEQLVTTQCTLMEALKKNNLDLNQQIQLLKKQSSKSLIQTEQISPESPSLSSRIEGLDYYLVAKLTPPHTGTVKCCEIIGGEIWVGCGDGSIRLWNSKVSKKDHAISFECLIWNPRVESL